MYFCRNSSHFIGNFVDFYHLLRAPKKKFLELKQFSEIGVQRFFIQSRENQEEAEALEKILSQEEMNILDG